jgi:trans-aconitate 2-methyltransferase
MRIVDLGCGSGELTLAMHRALGARETIGVDNSASMLSRSAEFEVDGLRFEQADARQFATRDANRASFDLVLSNALLQWLPDQPGLLELFTAMLRRTGQVAIQVPSNEDHPSHVVAREIAGEAPFRDALQGHVRRFSNLSPEGYASLLNRLGYADQHVRLQVYPHRLPCAADVVEWVRGTLLTDYQRRLSPEVFDAFVERYRERLLARLEDSRPFFYPFKRILVWGRLDTIPPEAG